MGASELPVNLNRHLLTVDDYYRMTEVGLLPPELRTELIEGEIIEMAAMNSRHAGAVNAVMRRLILAVGESAMTTCQTPVRLSNRTEPQPDLMLLRPRADGYAKSHPKGADVLLVIEIADSSARYDREIKAPLYARHGVPELWIIDLDARQVRFLRQPVGSEFTDITSTETPGAVPLPGLQGLALDLGGILA